MVPVKVETEITASDDIPPVETKLFVDAQLAHRNNKQYVSYQEYDMDLKTYIHRRLCYDPVTRIVKIKTGDSNLQIEEGKSIETVFKTPFGEVPVILEGKRVIWKEDNLEVDLEYSIVYGSGFVSTAKIKLRRTDLPN